MIRTILRTLPMLGLLLYFGYVFAQSLVPNTGVVIEELDEDAALYKAGARVGDHFTHWERLPNAANPGGAEGSIADPFDWWFLEKTQAPRGTVRLFGDRGGKPNEVEVPIDYWEAKVRPIMPNAILAKYLKGKQRIESGNIEEGFQIWESMDQGANTGWALFQIGNTWRDRQNCIDAQTAYLKAKEKVKSYYQEAVILREMGFCFEEQENWDDALTAYQEALDYCKELEDENLGVAYFLSRKGTVAFRKGELSVAESQFKQVLKIQKQKTPNSLSLARIFKNLGKVAKDQGNLEEASNRFRQALAIETKLAPKSLAIADTLNSLGNVLSNQGNLVEGERSYKQALIIIEKKAPNSLKVASVHNNLASVAFDRGVLAEAEWHLQQSLDIVEQEMPNSLALAGFFHNLGSVASRLGDLEKAERRFHQALEIQGQKIPNSLPLAMTLENLGVVANERGNLVESERCYEQALSIKELRAPNSLSLASTLENLGNLAISREDFAEAERRFVQALGIKEQKAPRSITFARALLNSGTLAHYQGDLSKAERLYLKAQLISKDIAPTGYVYARTLENLGLVSQDRKDFGKAERYFRQAVAIEKQNRPDSLSYALSIYNLGEILSAQGDLAEAERYHHQARFIQEQKAPNSKDLAHTFNSLAKIYQTRKPKEAQDFFERSLDVLEAQFGSLGGPRGIRTKFSTQYQYFYREYISFLIGQSAFKRAFEILERSRAKVLRDMIMERHLVLSNENLPLELDTKRRHIGYILERAQAELASQPEKEKDLVLEIQEHWRDYEAIKRQIKSQSPELAALNYPQALKLTEIKENLDSGTLLLSYSVMEDQTFLFLVRKDAELKMVTTPKGSAFFQEEIKRWTSLEPEQKAGHIGKKIFDETGFKLSQLLIEPIRDEIEDAERLLIIPDGPLWYWPFGGLNISKDREQPRYLIEEKPISTVVSASLYADLKKRPKRDITKIAAIGDAVYPQEKQLGKVRGASTQTSAGKKPVFEPSVRALLERRSLMDFGRIPETALEVQSIADLYGPAVRTFLREEANEANFKSIEKDVDIVHVAAHGLVDDARPLDSALVLTVNDDFKEGEESGVLFAWEVFESIRLDADLVVLSACETGLGEVSGGEGLIGLTRAFQFAGARSIIASHWKIEDQSTAMLMTRFYRYLKDGLPKDKALQKAQIDLIRQPMKVKKPTFFGLFNRTIERDVSHPYHWAAFQLIGPWD